MPHQAQNLKIVQGSNKTIRLTATDAAGERVDLTGSTVHFCVKVLVSDPATVIAKVSTIPTQITILTQSGSSLGQADIFIVPADTSGLTAPLKHFYDAWVVFASGDRVQVVGNADFLIVQSVTVLP